MATLADWLSWELWTQVVHAPLLFWIEAAHAVLSGRAWAWYVVNRENILSLATVLAGGIGIPLLWIRTFAANQSARAALEQAKVAAAQAKTAAERHEEQTKADLERRIMESFAKAVEQLGSDKLATRLGGIYTLERISQETEREYWPIMETLTAYVREHSPWPPRMFHPFMVEQEKEPELLGEPEPSGKKVRPATDVQAILTVLGRRKKEMRDREREDQHLNLLATDLRGADLSGAHFERANLSEANLEDVNLSSEAHLEGADLRRARLKGAHLEGAHLEGADLEDANLKSADFEDAHLEGATLFGAHLEGSDLWDAQLEGAILLGAHLEGADFQGADLSGAMGLTQEQINSALGDKKTSLPEGLERPAHWTGR